MLSCARRLYLLCRDEAPPRHIGMMSRNDLVGWAASILPHPDRQMFLDYVDQLAIAFSGRKHPILPPPIWLDSPVHSPAEVLARDLLEAGTCPVWSAARQVAVLLQRERPRHSCFTAADESASFTFGAYSKGPFSGLCRMTLTHPNTARLLNFLIIHLCPGHRWATVGVMYNCCMPPHIDRGNSSEPNLVTSLSLHEAGEIWVECEGGTEFHEHSGALVAGSRFPVQLQTVCFAASRVVHCTCPWDSYDRVLLVAYTQGHWNSLRTPILEKLSELGFCLPTPKRPHPSPQLHLDCLPSVLRD